MFQCHTHFISWQLGHFLCADGPVVASVLGSRIFDLHQTGRKRFFLPTRAGKKFFPLLQVWKNHSISCGPANSRTHRSRSSMEPHPSKNLPNQPTHSLAPSSSQKGFLTLMGLMLLSVFLCLIAALTTLGFVLKHRMALSSHCVHSALQLQQNLSRPLEKLFKLNKKATYLRGKRHQDQIRLAAAVLAGNPIAAAAARAQLLITTQRQMALRAQQEVLLLEAKWMRQRFKQNFIPGAQRKTEFLGETQGLAVYANPPASLSPSYLPSQPFEERQSQTYAVRRRLSLPYLPLTKFVSKSNSLSFHFICRSSLRRKGGRWIPILKKVNLPWRSSYGSYSSAL